MKENYQINQPQKSYRYNIDSLLLLRFAAFQPQEKICDLGAGVGVIGLLAMERFGIQSVTAVEVQEELATFAKKNADQLKFTDQFQLYVQSWQDFAQEHAQQKLEKFDAVISNPPYGQVGEGRLSPDKVRQVARHEIKGNMEDLILSAKSILKPSGRILLMYPVLRMEELFYKLQSMGFKLQRLAMIHPYLNSPATQVMVEAVLASKRELSVERPVIVYQDQENYQPEIEAWVGKKTVVKVESCKETSIQ